MEQWLKDLTSDAYEVREEAREGLRKWAGSIRDLLEPRRDDSDPEVRRAVREALGEGKEEPAAPAPGVATDFASLGLVSLDTRGALEGLFRVLGQAAGARFELPDGYAERTAEAHLADVPFFQALEVVAEGVGLEVPGGFDATGSLRLQPRGERSERVPSSCVGPLRLRAIRVTRTRSLGEPSRGQVSLSLAVDVVPGVEAVSFRPPRVVSATDSAGTEYRETPGAVANVTFGVGATMSITLEPKAASAGAAAPTLSSLAVALPVRLRHERKSVRFAGLDKLPRELIAPGERSLGIESGTVTLQDVRRPEGPGGAWMVDVRAHLDGDVPPRSVRVALEEPDRGLTVLSALRSSTADGTVHLTGRGVRASGPDPVAVVVQWFLREEEGEVTFRLTDVPLR